MFRVKSSGPPKEDVVMSRASFRVELPIEAWDVMRDAIVGSQDFDLRSSAFRTVGTGTGGCQCSLDLELSSSR